MKHKVRKTTLSLVMAGLAAVVLAVPAEANRGNGTTTTTSGYVPPPQYGQDPHPALPDEPDPYANPVETTIVPVDLPAITDPGAGDAGDGFPLGPAPSDGATVSDGSDTRPETPADDGIFGGILSRTGAETMPLARAGLGAFALGLGLVILARRRRVGAASA